MAKIRLTAEELAANPQLAARIRAAQEAEGTGIAIDVDTISEDGEEIPPRIVRRAEAPRRPWVLIVTVAASITVVGWLAGGAVFGAVRAPARHAAPAPAAEHIPAPNASAPETPTQAASQAHPPVADQAPTQTSQDASQAPAQTPVQTQADSPPAQNPIQVQPTAPPSGPVTQPRTGYDVYGNQATTQQVTLQPIMSEPGPCPVIISGIVTGRNNRINLPVGIQSGAGMISVRAILDTGAGSTIFADSTLRNAGYSPVSGPIEVKGVGSGPLKAYWYLIPAPSVAVDGAWRPIMTESLKVMGVVNYPMAEALIGPDALRTTTLKMSGRNWTLSLPCTP